MSKAKRRLLESALPPAKSSLACYAAAMQPGFNLAGHTKLLIDMLESVEQGKRRRLIVSMPPQHGKSLVTSTHFPGWYLGLHPDHSIIFTTYGQELSDRFGRRVRDSLADDRHQKIFPACRLAPDSTSVHCFQTTAGGGYYAVGRGGPITGRGAHLLVIDDLLKGPEEANSANVRRQLHEWFGQVVLTRLAPDAAVIVVGTRWHQDDLIGWLLRQHPGEGWELLNLPAIAEANDPLGRAPGEPLWPERYGLDELESRQRQMGSAAFDALYQGHPLDHHGSIFRSEWFRSYTLMPASFNLTIQSWDTAYSTRDGSSYSACVTIGVTHSGIYVLSLWRGRVSFPELKRRLATLAQQWRPHVILIEDKASGQSLLQEIQTATVYSVKAVRVDSDKISRAVAVSPTVEAGRVHFPESSPFLSEFRQELVEFPASATDDFVDAFCHALNYVREVTSRAPVLFDVVERQVPGLPEPRPVPIPEAIAKKVLDGIQLTNEEENAILFGGLEEL